MNESIKDLLGKLSLRFKSHPWHGINIGENAPNEIMSFIEMTPHDTVKYEVDKESGYIMIDRPQKFSNIMPALYGFVPQTYCAEEVAAFCMEKTDREGIVGDADPLDICVLSERDINQGNILVPAIPIGGFRMIDGGEADDKIVAILKGDKVYGEWDDISKCPEALVQRLKHYFLTYKNVPGDGKKVEVEITHTYGKEEAIEVIKRSYNDYKKHFGIVEELITQ